MRVYRINAWMLLCQSVGFAFIGVMLLICWRPDAVAGASAFLITTIAVTAVPCWMLWSNTRTEPICPGNRGAVGLWRQILTYSLATWGTGSLVTLNRVLDRYMLVHAGTTSVDQCLRQVGAYHIVETVTSPLLALGALLSTLMLPHTVHLWEAKRNDETRHMIQLGTKLTVLGLTFAGACIVILKRVLLADIFGDVNMESGDLLEIVLVTTIVLGAYHTVRSYMLCSERPFALTAIWLGGLAVNVLLNLLFIPMLQVRGAALACLISSVVSTAAVMVLTHRAGLKLSAGTWGVCALPAVLLASPALMLGGLTLAVGMVLWTDCLLSADEKAALNAWLGQRLARRSVRTGVAV
jgi:O-antigen/teichoic acid export membrane protein